MNKRCYYEVLGCQKSASIEELKGAYRRLAKELHPDRNPGNHECEHKFKEINEAYDILKDGDKRAAYDRFGHAAFEQGGGGGGDSSGGAPGGDAGPKEDVVDAEFTEVDDDKKNKKSA